MKIRLQAAPPIEKGVNELAWKILYRLESYYKTIFRTFLFVGIKRAYVFCYAKTLRTLPTSRFSNPSEGA